MEIPYTKVVLFHNGTVDGTVEEYYYIHAGMSFSGMREKDILNEKEKRRKNETNREIYQQKSC